MANVKDITTMCKAGQVQEAYELAKTDLAARPADIWAQRAVGWVLYYMIKADSEVGNYAKLLEHINELKSLDRLTIANDSMIFDNVQFQIANFIKNNIFLTDIEASSKLSTLFSKFKDYEFKPSIGHSFFKPFSNLRIGLKCLTFLIGGIWTTYLLKTMSHTSIRKDKR